jgi:hypothetical protein
MPDRQEDESPGTPVRRTASVTLTRSAIALGAGLYVTPATPTGKPGVEMAGDLPVRGLGDVGIELHAEAGCGMAEPGSGSR